MLRATLDRIGFLLRDRETRAGRATNALLYALNAVFLGLYVVSTYPLTPRQSVIIRVAELLLGVVFLVEYVARIYSAEDRFAEVTNFYTVADLVAVLPVFVAAGPEAGFLRGLHILRVFRFLRLLVDEQQLFGRSLDVRSVRRTQLSITIFLIFFIASGFIYAVEVDANPEIGNFGDAFYYAVIAVSTVGFGDIIPVTPAGRWVTVMAVLVGFVLVPWQASRIRGLSEEPSGDRSADCPHCGTSVEGSDRYCRECGERLGDAGPGGEGSRPGHD